MGFILYREPERLNPVHQDMSHEMVSMLQIWNLGCLISYGAIPFELNAAEINNHQMFPTETVHVKVDSTCSLNIQLTCGIHIRESSELLIQTRIQDTINDTCGIQKIEKKQLYWNHLNGNYGNRYNNEDDSE